MGGDDESPAAALDVETQHEHLRTEAVGDLTDQLGTRDRGAVHSDLVGTAGEKARDVFGAAHSTAHGERDEDLLGGGTNHVVGRRPVVDGGRDIQEGDLVGALLVVLAGELDGIPGIAEVQEIDALDHSTIGDVETGNHADGDAHDQIRAAWIALTRMARAPTS